MVSLQLNDFMEKSCQVIEDPLLDRDRDRFLSGVWDRIIPYGKDQSCSFAPAPPPSGTLPEATLLIAAYNEEAIVASKMVVQTTGLSGGIS